MIVKEINRTIRFETRKPESRYRCRYGNKEDFEILRINISYNDNIFEVYEVDAQYLPSSDSIYFKAMQTEDGVKVYGWTAKVEPFIRKV